MTAFARAAKRNPNLAPAGRSVAAFVHWMRSLDLESVWTLEDLYVEYAVMQRLMGSHPLPMRRFGAALAKTGFIPRQVSVTRDGKRYRPLVIDLSDTKLSRAMAANDAAMSGSGGLTSGIIAATREKSNATHGSRKSLKCTSFSMSGSTNGSDRTSANPSVISASQRFTGGKTAATRSGRGASATRAAIISMAGVT